METANSPTTQPSNVYPLFQETRLQQVSTGEKQFLLSNCESATHLLVILFPQLGDFDSLEYTWWLQQSRAELDAFDVAIRAVGIGNLASGQQFCHYTGFPEASLFVDPEPNLHQQLGLYAGLTLNIPGLSPAQNAWVNLLLMCAGIASPGTLKEVLRGYTGDRAAPQLIGDEEVIKAPPLPALKGSFFNWAGGSAFQRPFELATLRLRNMGEVLSHWSTYVPDARYLTQRGGTFLFNQDRELIYEWRDPAILGFAENMNSPLSFLHAAMASEKVTS